MTHAGQEGALRLVGSLGRRPRVMRLFGRAGESGRALLDADLEGLPLRLHLAVELRALHGRRDLAADREEQIAGARGDRPPAHAVVDGEDADAPALRDHRRPQERLDAEHLGERSERGIVGATHVLEEQRLVGAKDPDERLGGISERHGHLRDACGRLGRAADAAAAAQTRLVSEPHHCPLEAEPADDGVQAAVEELVEIERRAEGQPHLVQRGQLGHALLLRFDRGLETAGHGVEALVQRRELAGIGDDERGVEVVTLDALHAGGHLVGAAHHVARRHHRHEDGHRGAAGDQRGDPAVERRRQPDDVLHAEAREEVRDLHHDRESQHQQRHEHDEARDEEQRAPHADGDDALAGGRRQVHDVRPDGADERAHRVADQKVFDGGMADPHEADQHPQHHDLPGADAQHHRIVQHQHEQGDRQRGGGGVHAHDAQRGEHRHVEAANEGGGGEIGRAHSQERADRTENQPHRGQVAQERHEERERRDQHHTDHDLPAMQVESEAEQGAAAEDGDR